MNKYQEALNKVYELISDLDFSSQKKCADQLRILQELVDKATPKKVILHYKHHLGTAWGNHVSRITCPSCNRRLKDKIPNNQILCPRCGQALDWSEKNV